MIMASSIRSSPQALAVLGLLGAGPLHPYGIQRLLKLWGKDEVVNVGNRANLYKTIKRLHEADLIAVRQTERDQSYPERTVYELTDEGRRVGLEWLNTMLSTPRNEFPEFPAALSFAMALGPEGMRTALEHRAEQLRKDLSAIENGLESNAGSLARVVLIEDEYRRSMIRAELRWVDDVVEDLRSGVLTWSDELGDAARSSMQEAGVTSEDPA
jgi:DNA-binding PadR family transcriptional regulator